jgi:hypothetical protein
VGDDQDRDTPAPTDPAADAPSAGDAARGHPGGAADPEDGGSQLLPPEVEYPEVAGTALPRRVETWRRRSATGALLTGFALGLREVLEPERDEPAIMLETSGTPPKDLPVEADLDDAPPRRSVVRIRPWLLHAGGAEGYDPDADAPPSGSRTATPARRSRRRRR